MSELFELYIKSGLYLKGWSPKTVVIYKRAFASFQQNQREAHTGLSAPYVLQADTLTKAQLEAWIMARRAAGMSPSGINIYIRAMNAFSAWLADEHKQPQIILKQLKAPQKPVTVFSDADISLLLSFKPRGFYELRTWTLLCLLLDTGLRINEAITLIEVDFDNLLLTVNGKGGKTRRVPFSTEVRKALWRYKAKSEKRRNGLPNRLFFSSHTGSQLMYRNVMRDVRKLCKKVGITKYVKLHLTRHTFACHFMKNGGSIYTLSRILGHSSVSTTQIYIRGLGVEDFKEEHARLSPLVRR